MDVSQTLEALRGDLVGCDLVAFADLSSSMVLSSSSLSTYAQEDMDRLSANAVTVLNGAIAEGGLPMVGEEDTAVHVAMTLDSEASILFLRAQASPNEALICVLAPSADLATAIRKGQDALKEMATAA